MDVRWITGEEPISNETIQWACNLGKVLSDNTDRHNPAVTTSQIRKFFGEVKRIQADYDTFKGDVPLLAARLAYAVGRRPTTKMRIFYDEFLPAIQAVSDKESYERFVKLLESTVAFHKFHGGRD